MMLTVMFYLPETNEAKGGGNFMLGTGQFQRFAV